MAAGLPTLGNTIVVRYRQVQAVRDVTVPEAVVLEVLNNFISTRDPTVNDDATQGYQVGSEWLNQTSGASFISFSNIAGAAAWRQSNGGAVTLITFVGNAVTANPNPITGVGTVTVDITAALLGSIDLSSLPITDPGGGKVWINGGALWVGAP